MAVSRQNTDTVTWNIYRRVRRTLFVTIFYYITQFFERVQRMWNSTFIKHEYLFNNNVLACNQMIKFLNLTKYIIVNNPNLLLSSKLFYCISSQFLSKFLTSSTFFKFQWMEHSSLQKHANGSINSYTSVLQVCCDESRTCQNGGVEGSITLVCLQRFLCSFGHLLKLIITFL